jgi:hypothetical protein
MRRLSRRCGRRGARRLPSATAAREEQPGPGAWPAPAAVAHDRHAARCEQPASPWSGACEQGDLLGTAMKFWSESWINGDRIPRVLPPASPTARRAWPSATTSTRIWPGARCRRHPVAGADLPRFRRAQPWRRREPARARSAGRPAPGGLLPLGAGGPAAHPGAVAEGEFSRGFARPAANPARPRHAAARQGLNDYTSWFAGDPDGRPLLRLRRPVSAVQ